MGGREPERGPRILVVEERRRDRNQLVSVLAGQGYVVFEASDTRSALDLIDRQHPQLVISSADARPVGGADLVRRLRARPDLAATRVAFYVGARDEVRARAAAARVGIADVLTSATSPDAVLQTVRALLNEPIGTPPAAETTSAEPLAAPTVEAAAAAARVAERPGIVLNVESGRDLAQVSEIARVLAASASALHDIVSAEAVAFGLFDDGRGGTEAALVVEMAGQRADACVMDADRLAAVKRGDIVRWGGEAAADRAACAMAVPLAAAGGAWGWLLATRGAERGPFVERDVRLASLLVGHLCSLCDRLRAADAQQAADTAHPTRELQAACAGEIEAVGSWEVDATLETLTWSDSLVAVAGRDEWASLRRAEAALALLHPDDRQRVAATFRRAVTEGADVDLECRYASPGAAERTLHVLGRRMSDQGPSGLVGLVADVTERRRLETRLLQAQRTAAMGLLAASVAHDFNNVLTAILGQARLLADDLADSRHRREMESIHRTAERGTELTRQLLVFSRTQPGSPAIVGLNDVIEDVASMLRRLIGGHVTLHTDLDPDTPAVRIDRSQLEQVVLNLVVNARDAMPGGGRIEVRTRRVALDGTERFRGEAPAAGVYASLSVADTGTGIDERVKERMFDPFFTTKSRGEGTGLGLTTVSTVVKRHGGYLDVGSVTGQGSVFVVCLPAIERRSAASPPRMAEPAPAGQGSRILVVEDEPEVRQLVRLALERAGHTVIEAASADEAETLIARLGGRIDLVIADVLIPGGTGPDLFKRLVEVRSSIRAIFMSGYPDEVAVMAAVDQLGAAFLQKPFTIDGLLAVVQDVLRR